MDAKQAALIEAKRNVLLFLDKSERADKVGAYNTGVTELYRGLSYLPACETGVEVTYSPANRAWVVQWHSQPLRVISADVELRSYLRGLLDPDVAKAKTL